MDHVLMEYWHCPTCGNSDKIPGPTRTCPNCGAAMPENHEMAGTFETKLTDLKHIQAAQKPPHWHCGHCNHKNEGEATECETCGNGRGASTDDTYVPRHTYDLYGNKLSTLRNIPVVETNFDYNEDTQDLQEYVKKDIENVFKYTPAPPTPPKPRRIQSVSIPVKPIAIGLDIILLILLIISFFYSKQVDVQVQSHRWERTISVLHKEKVQHSSWGKPPYDAMDVYTRREYHHTEKEYIGTKRVCKDVKVGEKKVQTGYKSTGNGYRTPTYRYDPIYENQCSDVKQYRDKKVEEDKYYYNLWEEVHHRHNDVRAVGNDKHKLYWPKFPHKDRNWWRAGGKHEHYTIIVKEPTGETHTCGLSFDMWKRVQRGQVLKGRKGVLWGNWLGLDNTQI